MRARPELVFFIRESLGYRTEVQLRQQLKTRGIPDPDVEAALQEAIAPSEYPDAVEAKPSRPSATSWPLFAAAVFVSAGVGFVAGRLESRPPAEAPAAAKPQPRAPAATPPPEAAPSPRIEVTVSQPAPQAEAANPGESLWTFQGAVYDLVTLKPVSEVAITLTDDESGRKFTGVSNRRGRYRIRAPSLMGRGYTVAFNHPDYSPTALDEEAGPAQDRPEKARRALAEQLARSIRSLRTIQGLGETPLETDFYLAPK